jgi:hypothetical protein
MSRSVVYRLPRCLAPSRGVAEVLEARRRSKVTAKPNSRPVMMLELDGRQNVLGKGKK